MNRRIFLQTASGLSLSAFFNPFIVRSEGFLSASSNPTVRDANYLLNLGPMADGTLPVESVAILKRTGAWYGSVKESLENVSPASTMTTNRRAMLTSRGNTLYVHINTELPGNAVKLTLVNTAPAKATLLNDSRNVYFCSVDDPVRPQGAKSLTEPY